MAIRRVILNDFTVFKDLDLELCDGLNVFVGENGTGKTHLMKVIYSACKAVKHDVSFPDKLVKVFRPDGSSILRLVRRKNGGNSAQIKVYSNRTYISMSFSTKTKKWNAEVYNEEKWEKQQSSLTCTFIPAKEILANAWNLEAAVISGNVEFDDTYVDIVSAAKVKITSGADTVERKKLLSILQKIINGRVSLDNDRFYLLPGKASLEFNLVAEGIRKIALLWQLIKNGTLEKGSILIWDEPEANLNPKNIPVIAEMLLELQRRGVQVFIATHDYFLAKYIEIRRNDTSDLVMFHSFYLSDRDNESGVKVESKNSFVDLDNNPILDTFVGLYKDEIDKAAKI
jgi:predicted ATP-dependent endonuclease of OLD family